MARSVVCCGHRQRIAPAAQQRSGARHQEMSLMQAKSYHVFAAKSEDNRDFATFAEAERYSRLFEIVSELIDWPSHKCVLQTISHDAKRRNSFDTAPLSWSELLARASDGVLHVL